VRTITTAAPHYLEVGDYMDLMSEDRRPWRVFLYRLFRRKPPLQWARHRVMKVVSPTTFLAKRVK
jgi:hypothetical protein